MEKTSKTSAVSRPSRNILLGLMVLLLVASLVPRISFAQSSPPSPSTPLFSPLSPLGLGLSPISIGPNKVSDKIISFGSCISNGATCLIYAVTYVVTSIGGLLVAVGAWLTNLALDANDQVRNLPAVQNGFNAMLAIANLGFVLGIIVIAIMTILRSQTYGVKQLLWRLIVMAILINFSLVIASVIINFSDQFTHFFIDKVSPTNGFSGFVDKLAQSFAPQKLLQPPTEMNFGFTDFMKAVLNMVFVIIFLFIIAITFFALAIMLLVRYVTVAILLIIMPIAWLLWIFPDYKSNWNKWWDSFLRWVFFPPVVVFFLYLAITTAEQENRTAYLKKIVSGNRIEAVAGTTTGGAADAIKELTNQKALKQGESGPIDAAAEMIIILGLAVGGLFMANRLAITGASTAMGMAQGAGKWAAGAVKGKALQYGTSRFRNRIPRGPDQKKRTFGESFTARAQQSTGLGRLGLGLLGRGFTRLETMGGEERVKRFEKEVGGMGVADRRAMLTSTIDEQKQVALIKSLTNDKVLEGTNLETLIGNKAKAKFDKSGMENMVFHKENVEKTVGMDTATYEATKKYEAIKDKNSPEALAALKEADKVAEAFWAKMKNKDLSMTQVNDFFDPGQKEFGGISDELRRVALHGIATTGADRIPGILAKMKSKVKEPFADELEKMIDQDIKELKDSSGTPFPQFVEQLKKLEKVKLDLKASLNYIAVGFGSEPVGGGGSKPTPDAAPH